MKTTIKKILVGISILFLIVGTFGVFAGTSVNTSQIFLGAGAVLYFVSIQIGSEENK